MTARAGFSGSLLVALDGEVKLRASAGEADVAAGTACSADTRFQIASVSKQFTAAAVMLLVDDGVIDLDDPVGRFLPDCAAHWRELTLHQLLSHTSGLEHWTGVPGFDVTRPGGPDEFLQRFAKVPLRSGTQPELALQLTGLSTGSAGCRGGQRRGLRPPVGRPDHQSSRYGGNGRRAQPTAPGGMGYRVGQRVDVAQFAAIPGTGDVWSTVADLARYTEAFEAGAFAQ